MGIDAILLMLLSTALSQAEGMVVKGYGKKHNIGGMFFNAIICVFAGVFFTVKEIVLEGSFVVPVSLWPYALLSCLMYATGFYTMYKALQLGSFGMTKLISSFSGIITIVYGVAFLHERPHFLTYIAIALVFASVILMRIEAALNKQDKNSNVSMKWLIYLILCVVSNGFIAILSRQQQLVFQKACDSEFKAISYFGAFLALMVFGLILERKNLGYIVKHGTLYGVIAGLFNGGHNFIALVIYTMGDISVSSPMTTGMGLMAGFALSVFLYKEKFTKMQVVSVLVGVVALVLFQVAATL